MIQLTNKQQQDINEIQKKGVHINLFIKRSLGIFHNLSKGLKTIILQLNPSTLNKQLDLNSVTKKIFNEEYSMQKSLEMTEDKIGTTLINWREKLNKIAPLSILAIGILREGRAFPSLNKQQESFTDGEILCKDTSFSVLGGSYLIIVNKGSRTRFDVYVSNIEDEQLRSFCEEELRHISNLHLK